MFRRPPPNGGVLPLCGGNEKTPLGRGIILPTLMRGITLSPLRWGMMLSPLKGGEKIFLAIGLRFSFFKVSNGNQENLE